MPNICIVGIKLSCIGGWSFNWRRGSFWGEGSLGWTGDAFGVAGKDVSFIDFELFLFV